MQKVELAAGAWIDPRVITKREIRYMSVDIDRGAGYGNTLTWGEKDRPAEYPDSATSWRADRPT
jgi:hypothetical protein